MKVLHITPHLGGGVGKAHAFINRCLDKRFKQTFCLLEKPIDLRFANMLRSGGAEIVIAENLAQIARLSREADIVQIEYISHPRLLECLARTEFPSMRSVIWAHNSGLFSPVIQPRLMQEVTQFIFSTEASLPIAKGFTHPLVINSGFGFGSAVRQRGRRTFPRIAYLGTVNFIKMHPGFFDVVDNIDHVGPVMIYGHLDKAVEEQARRMKHPQRVKFLGETLKPAEALSHADIFLYLLQPKHYGTGENALVEAMSLGLVPVVMNNPAERQIVSHDKTGLIANTLTEAVAQTDYLLKSPSMCKRLADNAVQYVEETKTPERSANQFMSIWQTLFVRPPTYSDFPSAIGNNPLDWYLATQQVRGIFPEEEISQSVSKGSLAHFKKVFAGDKSFGISA